jgi:surface protein
MFYNLDLVSLDLSNFNTSNVTSMSNMFTYNSKLKSINLSNFNTSNVTDTEYLFNSCERLTSLDLSNFDLGKVKNIKRMFGFNYELTNLKSFKNLGKGYTQKSTNYSYYALDLSSCPLNYESLIDVITNGLYDLNLTYDVANGGTLYTQQLKLGSDNLAKLTAEEIAIATNKGWTVS